VVITAHHIRSYGPPVTAATSSSDETGGAPAGHDLIPQYEIRVEGHLGSRWTAWFDGLTLTAEDDGTTVIHGPVVDQAALHGVLQKLRDLGIPLISLTQIAPRPPRAPHAPVPRRT
jgi:hypothetical protein